jgi:hypothetical protein
VEAADTGPFFHDNAVPTIEAAVAFYDGDSFNESPAGRVLAAADPEGDAIELDATQIAALAAFLRVINGLENVRVGLELLDAAAKTGVLERRAGSRLLERAIAETRDARDVLAGAGLHPDAVAGLERALALEEKALHGWLLRAQRARRAMRELEQARDRLVGPVSAPVAAGRREGEPRS